MERLISLYRGASNAWAVGSLVVANLVPLVGVAFFGWDLWTILALYWAENGIIGLWNVAKILRAEGTADPRGTSAATARLGAIPRAGIAAFFLVHYGIFWFVHGIFVLVALPTFTELRVDTAGFGEPAFVEPGIRAQLDLVAFGAIWLAVSHGISYVTVFLGRGEYRRVTPQQQAQAPYARLVVLHLTIIAGAMVSAVIGAPIGAMIVLVLLKLVLDLRLHLREHSRLATGPTRSVDAPR